MPTNGTGAAITETSVGPGFMGSLRTSRCLPDSLLYRYPDLEHNSWGGGLVCRVRALCFERHRLVVQTRTRHARIAPRSPQRSTFSTAAMHPSLPERVIFDQRQVLSRCPRARAREAGANSSAL